MSATLTRTMTVNVNLHPKASYGQEDIRTFPATRTGALEFLEAMGVHAPHVWYNLQGVAAEMQMMGRQSREEELIAADLLARAQWWWQEPQDALIPAIPDRNGDYWVTIVEAMPDGSVETDAFPLFRGLLGTAEYGHLPDHVLRGVLEARGYVDAAEDGAILPPAGFHAGETQQYIPVNIVREGEL